MVFFSVINVSIHKLLIFLLGGDEGIMKPRVTMMKKTEKEGGWGWLTTVNGRRTDATHF